jgi:hypothetical protein
VIIPTRTVRVTGTEPPGAIGPTVQLTAVTGGPFGVHVPAGPHDTKVVCAGIGSDTVTFVSVTFPGLLTVIV